jgi:hypothetical protein
VNIEQFEKYVAAFNSSDDNALYDFYSDDLVFQMLGAEIKGKDQLRRFYDFYHRYVRETLTPRTFVEGDGTVDMADAVIRFEGLQDLTAEQLADAGYGYMPPIAAGAAVDVNFFVSYDSADGKIKRIRCAVFEPPRTGH